MPAEPKHLRISRELLSELATGKFGPGGRLPSEAQLVERYGVSRPTVARALRELQDRGLIDRKVGAGSFARDTTSSEVTSRQLGLLIPGLGTTEVFEAICGELAGLARVRGYGLIWGGSGYRPQDDIRIDDAEALCDQFIQGRVAGVFFTPFEHAAQRAEVNARVAGRLRKAGIAVVLLDRDLSGFPSRSDFDLVGIDNFAGGYALADHLLKLGCRTLAFALRPHSAPTVAARVAGARAAMLDRGLFVPPDFAREGDPDDPRFAHEFLGTGRVDAILCTNDDIAALLMRSISRAGLQVPADIRVVGFDDVRHAGMLSVPLTTMHQPCRDIAVVALKAMLDRIDDPTLPPRSQTLPARLVVRESCGAYLRPTIAAP